jgi:hypothetical protein
VFHPQHYKINKYIKYELKKKDLGLGAPTCNPSYLGGRDQEDHGSKPAQANSSQDPISKEPFTEKGWWSGSRSRT